MKMLPCIALCAATLAACSPSASSDTENATPLPRRYAYPRFQPYDTTTVLYRMADLTFRLNAAAHTTEPRPGWMDISYPRYGATLHLSYTHPTGAQAIDNRRERMMLNLGEAVAEASDYLTPAGFECRELVAVDALVTPVQFLALGPGDRMVSGAVVLSDAEASADSIAPIVAALQAEVRTLLQSLAVEK